MPTELVLMQDMDTLGNAGDVITVSDGYARNYLVPRKIAEAVTNAPKG